MSTGLTDPEIYSVVNDYIVVDGGYLSDFLYRSHQEFYPYFCGLEIDPLKLPGTTPRAGFFIFCGIASLRSSPSGDKVSCALSTTSYTVGLC